MARSSVIPRCKDCHHSIFAHDAALKHDKPRGCDYGKHKRLNPQGNCRCPMYVEDSRRYKHSLLHTVLTSPWAYPLEINRPEDG